MLRWLREYGLLAVITGFFVLTHGIWLQLDTAPPAWDQAHYLQNSEVLYHTLTDEGLWPFAVAFSEIFQIKAPLISALPVPFYLLFGDSYESARYVNLLFLVLCSYYLYRLGVLLAGRREGLLSVLLLNTCPLIFGLSREILVEYGLMTFVTVWMYYFLKSDCFAHRKYSWVLGALLGLGMLLKISFFLYIIFPAFFIFLKKNLERKSLDMKEIKNVGIVVFLGVLISGTWYFRNFTTVIDFAFMSGYSEMARHYGEGDVFSIDTIFSYWSHFIQNAISVYFFALMVFLGILHAGIIQKGKSAKNLTPPYFIFLLIWFVLPFLVFTFAVNKDLRYTAPLFPALVLLVSSGIVKVTSGRYGHISLILILIFPVAQYILVSFSHLPGKTGKGGGAFFSSRLELAHPPVRERWPHEEIVRAIARDASKRNNHSPVVTLLFNHLRLNFINLNYYADNQRVPIRFNMNSFFAQEGTDDFIARIERDSDYLLTKTGDAGPAFTNERNADVLSLLQKGKMDFQEAGKFQLPDGTKLTLYETENSFTVYRGIEMLCSGQVRPGRTVNFGNKIKFLDAQVGKTAKGYRLELYWECLEKVETDYKVFVHVYSSGDVPVANADHYLTRNKYPTSRWEKGEVIRETLRLPGALPVKFFIRIGLYEGDTLERLPVHGLSESAQENLQGVKIYQSYRERG